MSENQNVEWKESWRDEYLKWVCGFANAHGGKIYIGINDSGEVVGVPDSKRLLEEIPNKIQTTLGIVADVNLFSKEDKDCVEICVHPSTYPINYKGEYHYRSGSTKQQLTGQALNQFLLKKTGITWDSVIVDNVTVREMRNDSFDIFREYAVRSGRMDQSAVALSNEELMDSLNLIENGAIKRAGVLLFHHNPEKWIPGAYVKIGFFENDADLRYQDEIHGSLMEQADKIVDLIYTKYLRADITYEGITRVETYPYPKEAIREAVFNAIAHKFYGTLIPIQISVYRDKLYIANDCVFPDDWTVADLMGKHRSRPYNPMIANAFFRAGLIESWGRGIEKIKTSCESAGNTPPEYHVTSGEFVVEFKSLKSMEIDDPTQTQEDCTQATQDCTQDAEKCTQDCTQTTQAMDALTRDILKAIINDSTVTQAQIAKTIGQKENTVKSRMRRLRKKGILTRDGTSQKGKWVILPPYDENGD